MRDIEWIRQKSKNFGLEAEYLSENSLQLHSKKYAFDSWMVVENDHEMELWHMNKKGGVKGVTYHLQKSIPKKKKIWVLQRIKRHNEYVAFYKKRNSVNRVDMILKKDRERFTIY